MAIKQTIILFDDENRDHLLPLAYTRPVAEIRIGITTIREKWHFLTNTSCTCKTSDYLSKKYPVEPEEDNLFVNACLIPDKDLLASLEQLDDTEVLVKDGMVLAYRASRPETPDKLYNGIRKKVEYDNDVLCIRSLSDIFLLNGRVFREDYLNITQGRISGELSATNTVIGDRNVFLEEGARAEGCIFNTTNGPVYLGRNSEVMEGSVIRGPMALCDDSTLKLGTKVYGATTIGPHCKVGGEINNSVLFGYSNKAHDGFLGNSVIGEWCNLGAGTNNSNLKNNYAKVKLWNYPAGRFVDTGHRFCGLFMGDHSKCGINTMFNTGTVVGVSANIFGSGFPRNFIPSFSWGGAGGFKVYAKEKAFETAGIVMQRRNLPLTDTDIEILSHIYDISDKYRKRS
ncbi:MAG: GlmU family protein [Bacteroidales bacterium]|jgi:UDP-N-acetylglucosamine diphosphorylase/glucosamine-1-phosphate N-acetyltransferase